MQFMNSSLENLFKNLSDDDFKCLTQAAWWCLSIWIYMNSFKRFSEGKIPNEKYFYGSLKDGDNGNKLDGHISDKEYLTCTEVWN